MAKRKEQTDDAGYKKTDEQLQNLEDRLSSLYTDASKDMETKFGKFLSGYKEKDEQKRELVKQGKMTEDEYKTWVRTQVFQTKKMQAQIDSLTQDLVNTDKLAMQMVNGELPSIYATNYNFQGFKAEMVADLEGVDMASFSIYNADAVARLAKENPDLLPAPKVDVPKDTKWNKTKINSAIAQGIIQGEPITDIASRLQQVTDMDYNAAIRNARTAVVGAQNAGRKDASERITESGVEMIDVWSATYDGRTRDTHIMLNGQERGKDGYFHTFTGEKLEYPCDPNGSPAEVYNCRCRLNTFIKGIDHSLDDKKYEEMMREQDYESWMEVKEKQNEKRELYDKNKAAVEEKLAKKEAEKVTALHITNEQNIESILERGFDLSQAGTGAGSTWGDGVYFTTGDLEKTYYQYRLGNENGVEAKIDTSGMLNVDLGTGAVKSTKAMYEKVVDQLPENLQKEYKDNLKEAKASDSDDPNFDALEKTLKDNYTGLVITQDQPNGFDPLSGGNQIVVYDTSTIDIVGRTGEPAEAVPDEKVTEEGVVAEEKATKPEPFETKSFEDPREVTEYFRGKTYDSNLGTMGKNNGFGVQEDPNKPATKWEKKLTYDQAECITSYTGENYESINNFLRGIWDKQEAEEMMYSSDFTLKQHIKNMDSAINKYKLDEPITVYRTCEREFLDKLSEGTIFHDEGYGSTSMIPVPAASGDVHFEISVPAGKGVGAYVDGLSWKEGEEWEFLLARGADYYVEAIEERKDGIYVKAIITGFTKET